MVTTFERLTRSLSATERAELLKKVQGLAAMMGDHGGDQTQGMEQTATSELELVRLGLWTKIWLVLVAFFTGKTRGDVLRDMAMHRLADEILMTCPGLLDLRRAVFLPRAREEIDKLNQAALPFRECVRRAFGEDQEVFVAFLGGHLLPQVEDRLEGILDFQERREEFDALELSELRRRVHEDLEAVFEAIAEPERRAVYSDIQALHRLRGVVTLPLAEILQAFDTEAIPGECAFVRVRKHLPALNAQILAVRSPPSPAALEGLFLFSHADELGPDFPLEDRLEQELQAASVAMETLRTASTRVPYTRVVRLVTGSLDYMPRPVGGGEDWFLLFKRFWTSRSDTALQDLGRQREIQRLREEAQEYLEVHRMPRIGLDGMKGIALDAVQAQELALSLALGFYHQVFFKYAKSFNALLERARFAKDENRRELAQVYAFLNGLDERLDALQEALRSDAELAESPPEGEVRRVRTQRARRMVESFLDDCAQNVKLATNLVEGILRGSPGNRYDTVFNLDTVGDWQGRLMSDVLQEAYDRFSDGLSLMLRVRTV